MTFGVTQYGVGTPDHVDLSFCHRGASFFRFKQVKGLLQVLSQGRDLVICIYQLIRDEIFAKIEDAQQDENRGYSDQLPFW